MAKLANPLTKLTISIYTQRGGAINVKEKISVDTTKSHVIESKNHHRSYLSRISSDPQLKYRSENQRRLIDALFLLNAN